MYHRVATTASDPHELCVSPQRFAEQLELLHSAGEIMPLRDLARAGRPRRGLAVAVTFDDGYADNALAAVPLLEAHDAPATVFVIAGEVGSGRPFWWDRLGAALLGDGNPTDERLREYWSTWERLRVLSAEDIERELESLSDGADGAAGRPLSEAELRSLGTGPVEIGAHTVSHPSLTALPPDEQEAEISGGRARLEELLGRRIESFAYPYGDYDSTTVRLVRKAGFTLGCTIHENPLSRFSSRFRLPRLAARNWTADELERRLAAWTGDLALRR